MVRIFIDDERDSPRGAGWRVVRSHEAFLAALTDRPIEWVSFDHDLGSNAAGAELPNGQACMHALIDAAIDDPARFAVLRRITLHSANPVGRANMRGLIEGAQRHGILAQVEIIDLPVTSFPIDQWRLDDVRFKG